MLPHCQRAILARQLRGGAVMRCPAPVPPGGSSAVEDRSESVRHRLLTDAAQCSESKSEPESDGTVGKQNLPHGAVGVYRDSGKDAQGRTIGDGPYWFGPLI